MDKDHIQIQDGGDFSKFTLPTDATEQEQLDVPSKVLEDQSFFRDRSGVLWSLLLIFLLGSAVFASIYIYVVRSKPDSEPEQSVAIVESVQSPEPTEPAKPERGNLVLEVLNGAGIPGSASEAKTLLEGLGYTSVATANAASFDFATTMVAVKESKKEFTDFLIEDLSASYNATPSAEFLDESGDYDAIITLGAQ